MKRQGRARRFQNAQQAVTAPKFKGKTDDLEDHVFDVGVSNQSQLFADTIQEIAEYAGRSLKELQDIGLAIEKIKDVKFTVPTKQSTTPDLDAEAINIIYKTELGGYIKRTNQYCQNKSSMYVIVFGQCTESMRAKIEGDPKFKAIKNDSNVIALLKLICDIAFDIE